MFYINLENYFNQRIHSFLCKVIFIGILENISIITSNGLFEVFEPIAQKAVFSRRIAQENETFLAGNIDGEVILTLNLAKNGTAFIGRTHLGKNIPSKMQVLDNVSGNTEYLMFDLKPPREPIIFY